MKQAPVAADSATNIACVLKHVIHITHEPFFYSPMKWSFTKNAFCRIVSSGDDLTSPSPFSKKYYFQKVHLYIATFSYTLCSGFLQEFSVKA